MKNMMVIHMGENLRYLRKKKSDFVETSMQQYDYYSTSPQLSKEQLLQMMQVVENIRLNRNKKYL